MTDKIPMYLVDEQGNYITNPEYISQAYSNLKEQYEELNRLAPNAKYHAKRVGQLVERLSVQDEQVRGMEEKIRKQADRIKELEIEIKQVRGNKEQVLIPVEGAVILQIDGKLAGCYVKQHTYLNKVEELKQLKENMKLGLKNIGSNKMSEKEYRSLRERVSYSDYKLLDNDREKFFKERVMGEKKIEKKSQALLIGDLVHCSLSGIESSFEEKFHIAQVLKPVGQVGELCDKLVERTIRTLSENEYGEKIQQSSFETIFEEALQSVQYNYKGEQVAFKNKSKEKVLEMFQETGELYYKECIENLDRQVVTIPDIEKADKIAKKIKEYEHTADIATCESDDSKTVLNEFPIMFDVNGIPHKAMPDRMIVHHDKEQIQMVDWKTNWDVENGIVGAYLKQGYYLQAALYYEAVREWANQNGYSNYIVQPMLFVFCDNSTGWTDPTKFQLKEDDIDRARRGFTYRGNRYKGLTTLKEDLQWYLETGKWTADREVYMNGGYLKNPIRYGSI